MNISTTRLTVYSRAQERYAFRHAYKKRIPLKYRETFRYLGPGRRKWPCWFNNRSKRFDILRLIDCKYSPAYRRQLEPRR